MDTDNLEVGSRVAYNTATNYFEACFIQFSEVAKKTKTGRITLVNGTIFNPSGKELKSEHNSWPCATLVDVVRAEEKIEEKARENRSKNQIDKLQALLKKAVPFTDEQTRKIDELIATF